MFQPCPSERFKHVFLGAFINAVFLFSPAHAQTTAGELYDRCDQLLTMLEIGQSAGENPILNAGLCMGFVGSALETHNLYVTVGSPKMTCVPNNVAHAELAKAFVDYMKEHPNKLREAAAPNVLLALTEAYPCDAELESFPAPRKSNLDEIVSSLPKKSGRLIQGNRINNEPDNPGLGTTIYYDGDSAKATVYVYDLGIDAVTNGLQSEEFESHYLGVVKEVQAVYGNQNLVRVKEFVHTEPKSRIKVKCTQFRIEPNEEALDTIVCLRGHSDHFLKIRYTEKSGPQLSRHLQDFLDGILSSLNE